MDQYGMPVANKSYKVHNVEEDNFSVDVSTLPQGVYIIQALLGNERKDLRIIR